MNPPYLDNANSADERAECRQQERHAFTGAIAQELVDELLNFSESWLPDRTGQDSALREENMCVIDKGQRSQC